MYNITSLTIWLPSHLFSFVFSHQNLFHSFADLFANKTVENRVNSAIHMTQKQKRTVEQPEVHRLGLVWDLSCQASNVQGSQQTANTTSTMAETRVTLRLCRPDLAMWQSDPWWQSSPPGVHSVLPMIVYTTIINVLGINRSTVIFRCHKYCVNIQSAKFPGGIFEVPHQESQLWFTWFVPWVAGKLSMIARIQISPTAIFG